MATAKPRLTVRQWEANALALASVLGRVLLHSSNEMREMHLRHLGMTAPVAVGMVQESIERAAATRERINAELEAHWTLRTIFNNQHDDVSQLREAAHV